MEILDLSGFEVADIRPCHDPVMAEALYKIIFKNGYALVSDRACSGLAYSRETEVTNGWLGTLPVEAREAVIDHAAAALETLLRNKEAEQSALLTEMLARQKANSNDTVMDLKEAICALDDYLGHFDRPYLIAPQEMENRRPIEPTRRLRILDLKDRASAFAANGANADEASLIRVFMAAAPSGIAVEDIAPASGISPGRLNSLFTGFARQGLLRSWKQGATRFVALSQKGLDYIGN